MHDHEPNQFERPSLDELHGPVREAVEIVRLQPIPFGALADAQDRAKKLEGTSMMRSRQYTWRQMAMAAMVAAVIIGPALSAALWLGEFGSDGDTSEQYAEADNGMGLGVPLPNGMRAVTFRVDADDVEAGFIQPN